MAIHTLLPFGKCGISFDGLQFVAFSELGTAIGEDLELKTHFLVSLDLPLDLHVGLVLDP